MFMESLSLMLASGQFVKQGEELPLPGTGRLRAMAAQQLDADAVMRRPGHWWRGLRSEEPGKFIALMANTLLGDQGTSMAVVVAHVFACYGTHLGLADQCLCRAHEFLVCFGSGTQVE
jgi:hypothetical protein